MTLKEIQGRVKNTPKEAYRVPSPLMIREASRVVEQVQIEQGVEVSVYENGYVIYQKGRTSTVFSIHDCRDYTYSGVTEEVCVIPYEEYADKPWEMRAFMEGEDRLVHNMNARRKYYRELSYNKDWRGARMLTDEGESDPLRLLIEKETRQEELDLIPAALDILTKKQRYAITECILKNRQHLDVARELGTGKSNVSNLIDRGLSKIRTELGITFESFAGIKACSA